VLRFGFLEDLDFWNQDVKSTLLVDPADRSRTPSTLIWSSRLYKFIQDVKSTLHVDPAGQKPNTLNPDLVK